MQADPDDADATPAGTLWHTAEWTARDIAGAGLATMAVTLQWFIAGLGATHAPLASAFAHTFLVSALLNQEGASL